MTNMHVTATQTYTLIQAPEIFNLKLHFGQWSLVAFTSDVMDVCRIVFTEMHHSASFDYINIVEWAEIGCRGRQKKNK